MKKLWTGIKKVLGAEPEKKWRPEPLAPAEWSTRPTPRIIRISKGWRIPSFRRRKPLGPDAKRRAARLAFIRESQTQGIAIAARRRAAQLRDKLEGGHLYMTAFRRSLKGV